MSLPEPRPCAAGQRVTLTPLGKAGAQLPGQVVSLEGTALHLLVDTPMEVGAALKAECHDALMLGEVCHCRPDQQGFALDVRLEHALLHTAELAQLALDVRLEDALRHTAELARLAQVLLEGAPRPVAQEDAAPPHAPDRR